jgi:hypothetical protein
MQITRPRGEYIEKIVRDAGGRLVRLSFCVFENGGHVRARLLNAVYLEEKTEIENKVLFLGSWTPSVHRYSKSVFVSKITSPYFNSNLLNFLGSKPRAPTF